MTESADALENEVRRLVAEVLRVEEVAATDDFLGLGGASLEAIDLANRLEETYGVEVSVADIFEATSVGAIAGLVRSAPAPDADRAG